MVIMNDLGLNLDKDRIIAKMQLLGYRPIKLNNLALMFEPNKPEGRTDRKANVVYNDTLSWPSKPVNRLFNPAWSGDMALTA